MCFEREIQRCTYCGEVRFHRIRTTAKMSGKKNGLKVTAKIRVVC